MIAQSLLENRRLDHAVRYVGGKKKKSWLIPVYLSLSLSLSLSPLPPLYLGNWDRRFFEQETRRRWNHTNEHRNCRNARRKREQEVRKCERTGSLQILRRVQIKKILYFFFIYINIYIVALNFLYQNRIYICTPFFRIYIYIYIYSVRKFLPRLKCGPMCGGRTNRVEKKKWRWINLRAAKILWSEKSKARETSGSGRSDCNYLCRYRGKRVRYRLNEWTWNSSTDKRRVGRTWFVNPAKICDGMTARAKCLDRINRYDVIR